MAVQYPEPEKEISRPGDSTKRIVVFLFGALFAVLGVAAATKKEFGFAALLGLPALICFAIALWGDRKTVVAAKEFTDITNLP
ncbi:MAG TPA: hypothetical protein VGD88_15355 [Opitutaceae bacterium]